MFQDHGGKEIRGKCGRNKNNIQPGFLTKWLLAGTTEKTINNNVTNGDER